MNTGVGDDQATVERLACAGTSLVGDFGAGLFGDESGGRVVDRRIVTGYAADGPTCRDLDDPQRRGSDDAHRAVGSGQRGDGGGHPRPWDMLQPLGRHHRSGDRRAATGHERTALRAGPVILVHVQHPGPVTANAEEQLPSERVTDHTDQWTVYVPLALAADTA